VELLYRRCLPAARRPAWEVSSLAFCLVEDEAATGLVEGWRVEQVLSCGGVNTAHPPCGSRRIWIQGHRCSGRVPGRWTFSEVSLSPMVVSFFCGSFQSLMAMEFRVAKGRWQLIPAVAGDELRRRNPVCKGPGDLIVIFFVSEGPLCNRSGGTAVLCTLPGCTCVYPSLYGIF
jgi:hypothetical protein